MSLEFKTVYLDMPDKRKYWIYSERDGYYHWKDPPSDCTGSEAVDKFTQYHDTLTQCSTEKLRKIADAMGFHITDYIPEEVQYRYRPNDKVDYEKYYYSTCKSIQGYFAEMPDVTFKLEDTQYGGPNYESYIVSESEGVNMYVLTNNGFKRCDSHGAFFGNFYYVDKTIYRNTCFKTSFFKIIDIAGGVHILPISNSNKSVKYDCHIINLFDTATHDWVDYGVTIDQSLHPMSDSDKDLERYDYEPAIYADADVGTQKFITKMKDNEAWYLGVRGNDLTYQVGLEPRLNTSGSIPSVSKGYRITTLSNGIKIFSTGFRDSIAFKD